MIIRKDIFNKISSFVPLMLLCDTLQELICKNYLSVEWKNVFKPSSIEKFNVHGKLNHNVGLLRLFPSITVEVVSSSIHLLFFFQCYVIRWIFKCIIPFHITSPYLPSFMYYS